MGRRLVILTFRKRRGYLLLFLTFITIGVQISRLSPGGKYLLRSILIKHEDAFQHSLSEFDTVNQNTRSNPNTIISNPVFVTAYSDNHFYDGLAQLSQLNDVWSREHEHIPKLSLYLYDLGIRDSRKKILTSRFGHFLTIRRFPFEYFPPYVAKLREYRWKPLVIADVLKQHDSLWWIDASVKITSLKNLTMHYKDLRKCDDLDKNCGQYPVTFVWPAGTSIFASTNPGIYDYFPINDTLAKQTPMLAAGVLLIFRTKRTESEIISWWVLCALQEDCMSPKGHRLKCDWQDDRNTTYLGCHRYDQSALNILVASANGYQQNRYKRLMYTGFKVNRLQ